MMDKAGRRPIIRPKGDMLSPPVFRGLLPFPSLPSAAHGRVLAVAYPAPVQRGQTHRARCIRINEAH